MNHTMAYIHDNGVDVVPLLSVAAIRRLALLLDTVDNQTKDIWFWKRWKIFYEYASISKRLVTSVLETEEWVASSCYYRSVQGEVPMSIPVRRILWMTKDGDDDRFECHDCHATKVAGTNIFLRPGMLTDHMPEQYEDVLDDCFILLSDDKNNDDEGKGE